MMENIETADHGINVSAMPAPETHKLLWDTIRNAAAEVAVKIVANWAKENGQVEALKSALEQD